MKRAYSLNTNTDENSTASSIRPLKTNYLRMKTELSDAKNKFESIPAISK